LTLTPANFAELMAALGPFENSPLLAVAVSGGADSMALLLLADQWARARGGVAVGLTVDHRLRPESGREACQVGVWLAARGIPHHILAWTDSSDRPGLQARARAARYRLLGDWCRDHHALHLLLAHHREDQAETLLLRLARGSGVDGLAAMSAIGDRLPGQILRPLLSVPKAMLQATLDDLGQDWITDPSNQADRFARVRWRRILAAEPIDTARLALTAGRMGRARQALERDCALLAAGYAWLDSAKLTAAPDEIALRLLAALCRCIGGGCFPPRLALLERLHAALATGAIRRRTLAGCLFAPWGDRLLVHREARALPPPLLLQPGVPALWDNRYRVTLRGPNPVSCGALGQQGARTCAPLVDGHGIPRPIWPSLPAIMDKHGILAVPPLGYIPTGTRVVTLDWEFAPIFPLAGAPFRLVPAPVSII
jgi:tRNA(Ile)-lysidine synthase